MRTRMTTTGSEVPAAPAALHGSPQIQVICLLLVETPLPPVVELHEPVRVARYVPGKGAPFDRQRDRNHSAANVSMWSSPGASGGATAPGGPWRRGPVPPNPASDASVVAAPFAVLLVVRARLRACAGVQPLVQTPQVISPVARESSRALVGQLADDTLGDCAAHPAEPVPSTR